MKLHLPEEVLTLIVSCLELPTAHAISLDRVQTDKDLPEIDPDEDILVTLGTLASLSSVCHVLHRISEPVLYKVWPGNRIKDPRGFIAALAARPERASLVKEIVIDDYQRWLGVMPTYEIFEEVMTHGEEQMLMVKNHEGDVTFLEAGTAVERIEGWRRYEAEKRRLDAPFDTPLWDLYRSSVVYFQQVIAKESLVKELRMSLEHAIREGHPDAVHSMLILMCYKHIEGFSLVPCDQHAYSLLSRTLTNQESTNADWLVGRDCISDHLENLQTLTLWMNGSHRTADGIGLLAPLLYTQSLVWIHVDSAVFGVIDNGLDLGHTARDLTISRKLRTLTLSNCTILGSDLSLLKTCVNLTSLQIVYDVKHDMDEQPWKAGLISATINDHLPNLEHLLFDVRLCRASRSGKELRDGMAAPFISMGSHAHLKTITASPAAFFAPQYVDEYYTGEFGKQWEPPLTEILPSSIERINFLGCSRSSEVFSKDEIERIHALMSSPAFERLQAVSFEWRSAMKPDFLSDAGWQQSLQYWTSDGEVARYAFTRKAQ